MIYQCQKCGLSKSDSAMGSILPQCKCDWNAPAAQRQWVGLTDDEIGIATKNIRSIHCSTVDQIARAIEAKLKEKNT